MALSVKKCRMIQAALERRTCRSFDSSKPVPRDVLEKIAAAAANSPTGCDMQWFDVYVVTNSSVLDTIAAAAFANVAPEIRERFKIAGPQAVFYGAPSAIFIVPARKDLPLCVNYDLGIIVESAALAATALGVQSAIIGLAGLCPAAVLKQALGLPNETTAIAVILGYQTADWKAAPRELTSPVRWVE
jgi:nitroreductase